LKTSKKTLRKCSAFLAAGAGAGAAVCLSSGGAQAAKVTGLIAASNAGKNTFVANDLQKCFGSKASWSWLAGGPHVFLSHIGASMNGTRTGINAYIAMHNAGVVISAGIANEWDGSYLPDNASDKYIAVKFPFGGTRYGWIHVISTNGTGTSIAMDKWGYEDTGASIKTLGESVSAKTLGLSDGRTKLMWSNTNEEGIARYKAQTKDASGAWTTVSSDAAGAGSYSATVPAGASCRLVVEKVDGAVEEIGF
jgi:hypothetical protein